MNKEDILDRLKTVEAKVEFLILQFDKGDPAKAKEVREFVSAITGCMR